MKITPGGIVQEKTVLMIAHRLKTVERADRLYVVEKGRIVQQGRHEEMLKEEGIYKSFDSERRQCHGGLWQSR